MAHNQKSEIKTGIRVQVCGSATQNGGLHWGRSLRDAIRKVEPKTFGCRMRGDPNGASTGL